MEKKVPILLYHSVADEVSHNYMDWAIRPARFAEHMSFLAEQHYTPLTVGQFVEIKQNKKTLPPKPVLISFDDGLADFYDFAYPVLKSHGFPATLYVVTKYVGKTSRWLAPEGEGMRPMMTWSQLEEVRDEGIQLGAHTLSHVQLDTVTLDQAREEIFKPKVLLEERLGQTISTFAYPHGYYSQPVRKLVMEAGYRSACAVKHAMSSTTDDTFALARTIVYRHTTVPELARLLAGEGLPVAPKHERLRTKAWRLVRQLQHMVYGPRSAYWPKFAFVSLNLLEYM